MSVRVKLPAAMLVLASPAAVYAQSGAPHILLYSFGGGFAGGLIGALLACWFCCKRRKDDDSKRQ